MVISQQDLERALHRAPPSSTGGREGGSRFCLTVTPELAFAE
jgi:hypothetical protein